MFDYKDRDVGLKKNDVLQATVILWRIREKDREGVRGLDETQWTSLKRYSLI